jgi:hypothetical protein
MDNYQCHVTLDNKTSEVLNLQSKDLAWGVFQEGPMPQIARMNTTGNKAFKATGTRGVPAGVEGTVVYQVGDDPQKRITISFDVPTSFWKSNRVDCTVPDGFTSRIEGFNGGGATESCTIVLTRASGA